VDLKVVVKVTGTGTIEDMIRPFFYYKEGDEIKEYEGPVSYSVIRYFEDKAEVDLSDDTYEAMKAKGVEFLEVLES